MSIVNSIPELHRRMLAMDEDNLRTIVFYLSSTRDDPTLRYDNLGDSFSERAMNLLQYCLDNHCMGQLIGLFATYYPIVLSVQQPPPDPSWDPWAKNYDDSPVVPASLPTPTPVVPSRPLNQAGKAAKVNPRLLMIGGGAALLLIIIVALILIIGGNNGVQNETAGNNRQAVVVTNTLLPLSTATTGAANSPTLPFVGGSLPNSTPLPPTNTAAPPSSTPLPPTNTAAPPSSTPIPPTVTAVLPTPTPCLIMPINGFGLYYSSHADVRTSLGCAQESESASKATYQEFQHGYMVWEGDTHQIFVFLLGSGTQYLIYPDTYIDGTPEPAQDTILQPGLHFPKRGFGKVWRENELQGAIGYAKTEDETPYQFARERFANGQMLWLGPSLPTHVFILFGLPNGTTGTWLLDQG